MFKPLKYDDNIIRPAPKEILFKIFSEVYESNFAAFTTIFDREFKNEKLLVVKIMNKESQKLHQIQFDNIIIKLLNHSISGFVRSSKFIFKCWQEFKKEVFLIKNKGLISYGYCLESDMYFSKIMCRLYSADICIPEKIAYARRNFQKIFLMKIKYQKIQEEIKNLSSVENGLIFHKDGIFILDECTKFLFNLDDLFTLLAPEYYKRNYIIELPAGWSNNKIFNKYSKKNFLAKFIFGNSYSKEKEVQAAAIEIYYDNITYYFETPAKIYKNLGTKNGIVKKKLFNKKTNLVEKKDEKISPFLNHIFGPLIDEIGFKIYE